jgi:lysophospholipase L1-like esterase
VYYGTDTRAQELLAGAVVAFLCALAGRFTVSRAWRTPVRLAGAIALAYVFSLFVTVDDRTRWLYQGGLLLFSFVVALVIFAAVQPGGAVRAVLSPRPLRWLGTISYGLYLWHWPIYVVCTPSRMGYRGTPLLLVRLALTVAAATASYYLVERPIRMRQFSKRLAFASVPTVVVGTVVAILLVTSGAPGQSEAIAAISNQKPAAGANGGGGPNDDNPFAYTGAQTPPPTAPVGEHPTKIAITGDSVAYTLLFAIAKEKNVPELVWDRSIIGCPLFAGDRIANGETTDGGTQCAPWRADRPRWLRQYRPDVVAVLSGIWDTYDRVVDGRRLAFGTPAFDRWYSRQLDEFITRMSSTGGRVALLTAPCNERPDTVTGDPLPENDNTRIDHLNQLYRQAVKRNPDAAAVVDLHGYLCPNDKFLTTRDGVTLREDDGVHFSDAGATLTSKWLLPRLQKLSHASS